MESAATQREVPIVSLNGRQAPSDEQVQRVGDSLARWGFVNLTDHGVSQELLERAYEVAAQVFSLSEAQKYAYEDREGGRQRGYTPFLLERAKGEREADLKEFWHIGRELPAEHPAAQSGQMRPNLFPVEVPAFKALMSEVYQEMDQLAHHMLSIIARYLELSPDRFESVARDGNSVLRVLNYPDVASSTAAGKVRAAAHEDINLLTLLPAATRPGLELLTPEGAWLPVNPPAGAIVCDTGDMMTALTGGVMPATTHRVVNPEGGSDGGRLSMPFFMHPHPEAILSPRSIGLEPRASGPVDGEGLSAHAFLERRLRDNGLS